MNPLKIIVKPVPRESVQRRHLTPVKVFDPNQGVFVDTGHVSGKTKAKNAVESLPFQPDREKGKYRTGLEELVENDFKGMDVMTLKSQRSLNNEWDDILERVVSQDKISRQTLYEIMDGVSPDFYNSKITYDSISPTSLYGSNDGHRTFIETFEVIMYDGANVFSSDTARGRLAIQLLKNRVDVSIDKNYNPNTHRWYIAEENEEELDRVKVHELENEAVFYLFELKQKFPEFKLYQTAIQLKTANNIPLIKGEVAPSIVYDQLNSFIKSKTKDKKDNIAKFVELIEVSKKSPHLFELNYLIQQGLNSNTLFYDKGQLYWKSKAGEPNVYVWRNEDAFRAFMLNESEKFNPKEKNMSNYYTDYVEELKLKGIRLQ